MNRRLTVTYYTEPQNLRHVSLPLRGVRATLIVVGLCCAWTVVSFVYLGVAGVKHLATPAAEAPASVVAPAELQAVTAAHAVEQAAAASADKTAAAPATEDRAAQEAMETLARLTQRLEALRAETKKVGTAAQAATSAAAGAMSGVAPAAKAEPLVATAAAASPANPIVLFVETPTFQADRTRLAASFTIQNKSEQSAEGAVWGVATFQGDDGQVHLVPSHAGLDVERFDHPGNLQLGTPYKARRLTQKSLAFAAPDGVAGKFKDVKILVSDDVRRKLLVAGFGLPE